MNIVKDTNQSWQRSKPMADHEAAARAGAPATMASTGDGKIASLMCEALNDASTWRAARSPEEARPATKAKFRDP